MLKADEEYKKVKLLSENNKKINRGFLVADVFLNQQYLDHYNSAKIVEVDKVNVYQPSKIRMFQIEKIVLDSSEDISDKMMNIYNSLHSIECSIGLVIIGDERGIKFYICTRSDQNPGIAGEILESTLKGNFPGITMKNSNKEEIENIINSVQLKGKRKSLAIVSMIPSIRNQKKEKESFVQGMEKFINTMSGKNYTMICLAVPVSSDLLMQRRNGFEELYSSMSVHSKLSFTYSTSESASVSTGVSENFSKSINNSISNTHGTSTSNTDSESVGASSNSGFGSGYSAGGWGVNWNSGYGNSRGNSYSYTSGNSFSQAVTESLGTTEGQTINRGNTETKGTSDSTTINYENKGVQTLLGRAEKQLQRINSCEAFGMWECSSYFISEDIATTVLAANTYKGLMAGEDSYIEGTHLNIWDYNKNENMERILNHISYLIHPKAEIEIMKEYSTQYVTPTSMVSGKELPMLMSFPRKSVSGLAVVEMSEFGREVVYKGVSPKQEKLISFGKIYHMGQSEKNNVPFDLDLLSSHCFITGSSGSGKSYTTYQLLDGILKKGIKMLIVEPAKGEYKQHFGGLKGVRIYTTDPAVYQLFQINPFQFPDEIHIAAHMESLMQIFKASWPLYAAMPAVLKEAIETAYRKCGWDVLNSIWYDWISSKKYPTFQDVLEVLPQIIDTSEYSADSKGDYKGALLTRVQAMTVGLNNLIFKNNFGLDDKYLFDSNTIIDLSEVGSEETISLLMAIIIMKLNEYRRAQRKRKQELAVTDEEIRHVTILEEAHNLLKRTSKEQGEDGGNMIGESVRMISNSIKEMRTYGEGFIIIDQSPLAVDNTVIENTATKIIMNTPSEEACKELGAAISLSDDQKKELSRLNVGVAAIYQKGWLTPVLMQVNSEWVNPYKTSVQVPRIDEMKVVRGNLVECFLNQHLSGRYSLGEMRSIIRKSSIYESKKTELEHTVELIRMELNKRADKFDLLDSLVIGKILMEFTRCDMMFSIIPTRGIYTFHKIEELIENADAEEVINIMEKQRTAKQEWMKNCFIALNNYAIISDEKKEVAVKYMLLLLANEDNPFSVIYNLID